MGSAYLANLFGVAADMPRQDEQGFHSVKGSE